MANGISKTARRVLCGPDGRPGTIIYDCGGDVFAVEIDGVPGVSTVRAENFVDDGSITVMFDRDKCIGCAFLVSCACCRFTIDSLAIRRRGQNGKRIPVEPFPLCQSAREPSMRPA